MICTMYSHHTGFNQIVETLKKQFPQGKLAFESSDEFKIAELTTRGGFLKPNKVFRITYRERKEPSFELPREDCSLTSNLKGMLGFVESLQSNNDIVKDLLQQKIQTINSEFSIAVEPKLSADFKNTIQTLAKDFDAILFAQPNNEISKSESQHFLDKELNLVLDGFGSCDVESLDVKIDAKYFDGAQDTLSEDQKQRKAKTEAILSERGIKINKNLPAIESEAETTIRSSKEIAERAVLLAMTNLVAFNNIESEQAQSYLEKYGLLENATIKEKAFLDNPTEEQKSQETWKCEGIWVLLWALKIVDDLKFPDSMCNLNEILTEHYPIGEDKDPNIFINNAYDIRSKAEILDANDLYYRINWANVDARIKDEEFTTAIPGVVYERHYALNWLINYRNQEWDDVSCDT